MAGSVSPGRDRTSREALWAWTTPTCCVTGIRHSDWGSAHPGQLLADDIVWRSPGRNPLSGDYRGKDAVLALFGRLAEETGGTLRARRA